MSAQVEFLSLEVQDFEPFRGRAVVSFARPPAGGRCGLTLVTGGGGSGKSSVLSALKLALWGGRHLDAAYFRREYGRGEAFATDWRRFINETALRGASPQASLRLTLCANAGDGAPKTMVITRSLLVSRVDSVLETLRVETAKAGEDARLEEGDFQECISALLPPERLAHLFSDGEQLEILGGLASREPRQRERAIREVSFLTGGRSLELWRDAAPIIELGNRLLACGDDDGELRLLPEFVGRSRRGANAVVPGVWVSSEPSSATQRTCIGSALIVGLHLSGDVRAPLVLDAPMSRMPPDRGVVFLEALSEVARSQVVIAAHEQQIDELALSLWDRVDRIYLVERPRDASTALLSEPVREGST